LLLTGLRRRRREREREGEKGEWQSKSGKKECLGQLELVMQIRCRGAVETLSVAIGEMMMRLAMSKLCCAVYTWVCMVGEGRVVQLVMLEEKKSWPCILSVWGKKQLTKPGRGWIIRFFEKSICMVYVLIG
jgi:hypothetical protein